MSISKKKSQHVWFRNIISWKVLERFLFACCDASNNERVSAANEWVFDASQLVNKDRSCALCGMISIKCVVVWYFVTVRCNSIFYLLSACRKLKILATELHCKFKIKYIHLHMFGDKVCTSRKIIFQSIKRSSKDTSLQTFI